MDDTESILSRRLVRYGLIWGVWTIIALFFTTQVFVMDETGGEVISVTTAGEKPIVRQGQLVQLVQLEAVPWAMETNGKARSGVSFRAVEIKQVEVRSAK